MQEPDGSWFGRWGMNYIYGTWSVLSALSAAGYAPESARPPRGRVARRRPESRRRLGGKRGKSYASILGGS